MVAGWMCCNDCSVAPGQPPHTGPGQPSPISTAVNPLVQCGPTATTTATATLFVQFLQIFSGDGCSVHSVQWLQVLDVWWCRWYRLTTRTLHPAASVPWHSHGAALLNLAGKLERSWFLQQTLLTSRQSSVSVFLNWICRKMNIGIRNASKSMHSNICQNITFPVHACSVVEIDISYLCNTHIRHYGAVWYFWGMHNAYIAYSYWFVTLEV